MYKLTTSAVILALCSTSALSNDFKDKIDLLLSEHNLMHSAQNNLQSAKAKVGIENSGWYPELSVTGDYGRDDYNRSNTTDSDLDTSSLGVSVRQLLWDFGGINSAIGKSKRVEDQARSELIRQRLRLILAAVEAEKNLQKAQIVYEHSEIAANHVEKQAQLETSKIKSGQGSQADLLQAKSQLASAQARKISAQGELNQARHRFQSVFGEQVAEPLTTDKLQYNRTKIPTSLEEAIMLTTQNHPDLMVGSSALAVAKADIRKASKSGSKPTLHLVAKYADDHNPDGSEFDREQRSIGLEFRWNHSLGGRSKSSEESAVFNAGKVEEELKNTRNQVVEDTRNIWNQLMTAKARAKTLELQQEITSDFLDLARKEYELGKRSFLNVVSNETSLINAKSESATAKIDIALAEFHLLYQTGQLNKELFE